MSEDKTTKGDAQSVSVESTSPSAATPSQQGVFSMKKPRRSRKWPVIVGIVVLLGLVGGGIWWWMDQRSVTSNDKDASANLPALAAVCDETTIRSTGKPISDNDTAALQPIAEGIVKKNNYRGDVNCNYILMRYYLMIGDVPNAQRTIDDLSYTYGNSGGYSMAFDPPALLPSVLRETLDVMIANNQETQKQEEELNRLDP